MASKSTRRYTSACSNSPADGIVRRPASTRGSVAPRGRAERIAESYPDAARRADAAKLLGHRVVSGRGSEAAIRPGEDIGTQHTDVLVAAVKQVGDSRENLEIFGRLVARIEVDYRVRGHPAMPVLIVLVAACVLAGGVDDAPADGKTVVEVVVGAKLR